MDVVGNNIANVNTVGFKSSTTVFEDTLSQVLRNGSAPTADHRRHQPGPGRPRRQGRRDRDQLQPGLDPGHRPVDSDFMISGDGFFVTQVRQPADLHPGRLLRLRRQRPARHPRRQHPAGLDGRRNGTVEHQRPDRRPVGARSASRCRRWRPRTGQVDGQPVRRRRRHRRRRSRPRSRCTTRSGDGPPDQLHLPRRPPPPNTWTLNVAGRERQHAGHRRRGRRSTSTLTASASTPPA